MERDHCDEFVADCHVRTAADVLVHTWNPVVLAGLRDGPMRRVDLREAIGGISDKALTDTLKRLTTMHLIGRETRPAAPPHVEYHLTELGRSFADGPLLALGRWAEQHGHQLLPTDDD